MKNLTLIALTLLGACNVTDLQSANKQVKAPDTQGACNAPLSLRFSLGLSERAISDGNGGFTNTHERILIFSPENGTQEVLDLLQAQKLKVEYQVETKEPGFILDLPDDNYDVRVQEGEFSCYSDGAGAYGCGNVSVIFHTNDEANTFQDTCFKPVN